MILIKYFTLLFICASASTSWDAVSRFVGLRFECPGTYKTRRFAISVRDLADELSAFGWVQVSQNGTGVVVGEFRGTHSTAPVFEDFLREGPPGISTPCVIHHYPSSLIRLHFADFKILVDSRKTCFESPPHKCKESVGESRRGEGEL